MEEALTFTTVVEKFDSNLWGYHFMVPELASQELLASDARRVICVLNGKAEFQCALMPKGEGQYFINLNKKLRDQLRLTVGSQVDVALRPDNSTYGLPMPEEFAELLRQDPEGDTLFHALTPGKQRNLLYIVGHVKSPDLRISKAMICLEHLKNNNGKINFRQLNAELKNPG
ncbi:MAG: DUF1905 domain-containing protein [Bacteroidetes bacterium]|nr:MAG: DUF1905 domain-containing protein [Bacteroidota bacterium]